eukprot:jgi/Picsp_1/2710/NSC_00939-R1_hypothetical protein COCSUDRAFT_64482 [Coccomyxa subellipsoidea C-169]
MEVAPPKTIMHEAPYQHYHAGWSGNRIVRCNGLECKIPVAPLVIACLIFVMILYIIGVWLWSYYKFERALKLKIVPAKLLLSQFLIKAKDRGDIKNFDFIIRRPDSRDEVKEDECPVCLKDYKKPGKWLLFSCGHATCFKCFRRITLNKRLHTTCPLCRQYIAEGEGDRGLEVEERPHRRRRRPRQDGEAEGTEETSNGNAESNGQSTEEVENRV